MGAKIAAGAVLGLIGLLLVIFGVACLAYALAVALQPALGEAGGAAVTGAIFVGPPVLWAALTLMQGPKPKPKPKEEPGATLVKGLLAAVAKETPWIAIAGAVLVGVIELFFARMRRRK